MKLIINSEIALQSAVGQLREQFKDRKYLTVSITHGKARSLDQNAISHAWYEQVSRELREDTPLGVKSFCKLHFGVPILRAEDDDFRAKYDKAVKPMAYEDKLILMEWFPVTSLMTTPQLSQYLESVQRHYQRLGVWLEFPEPQNKQRAAA
ncbi:NinB/YbcN family protein [Stenotrophomonas muris]|uniref:hypothetical protein n=1 Tax=Stenotrophomonas muris TaxID=2963283 RepID=UPI0039C6F6BC